MFFLEFKKVTIFACMKLEISDWDMIPYAGAWEPADGMV